MILIYRNRSNGEVLKRFINPTNDSEYYSQIKQISDELKGFEFPLILTLFAFCPPNTLFEGIWTVTFILLTLFEIITVWEPPETVFEET